MWVFLGEDKGGLKPWTDIKTELPSNLMALEGKQTEPEACFLGPRGFSNMESGQCE